MKITPEQFIINTYNKKFKKNLFLISGNEETLIKKIQELLVEKFRGENDARVIKEANGVINSGFFDSSYDLFATDFNIYIFENPKDVDIDYLENIAFENIAIIIAHTSLKTTSKLKRFVVSHSEFVSISCYKLSREIKAGLMNHFLNNNTLKMSKECYWYFVDNSSDYYQLFENEINKVFQYKKENISLEEMRFILSKESSDIIDVLFFLVLSTPKKIIFQTQKTLNSPSDSFILIQRIKFFMDIIYKSKNSKEAMAAFPRYMFKSSSIFLEIFNKTNSKNILKILNLLKKTELLLKKHNSMYLIITQRFLLNVKKSLS